MIDGATNSVITTITVGDYPCAFTWNPVQNRTYVANYYGSSISVIRDVVGIEETMSNNKNLLLEVFPNPVKSTAVIKYGLAKPSNVSIKVYNIAGECVKTLVNRTQDAGLYEIGWNGKDDRNHRLPQGVYFLKMEAGDYSSTSKIVMVR